MAPLPWGPLQQIFSRDSWLKHNTTVSGLLISVSVFAILLLLSRRSTLRKQMDKSPTREYAEDKQQPPDVKQEWPDPSELSSILSLTPDLAIDTLSPVEDPLAGIYFPITSGQLAAMADNPPDNTDGHEALAEIQRFMAESTTRDTTSTHGNVFAYPDFMRLSQDESGRLWSRKVFHIGEGTCEACAENTTQG